MLLGYTSIAVTLMIWASFFLSLKGGANSVLAPSDIALTRFLIRHSFFFLWYTKLATRLHQYLKST